MVPVFLDLILSSNFMFKIIGLLWESPFIYVSYGVVDDKSLLAFFKQWPKNVLIQINDTISDHKPII